MTDAIDYYDRNGATFFEGSVHADMSADRSRFLKYVKPVGSILDGGCGSGRDALAFKNAGYVVMAMDGSAEMVRRASRHTGLAVRHLRFEQIEWRDLFDGIWTCASLLHVPRANLPDIMARLARALRPGGAWYLSFKLGERERSTDRHFTDMTEPMLSAAIADTGLVCHEIWTSADVRPGREHEGWVAAIAAKAG